MLQAPSPTFAGSATWLATPATDDWNTAGNWAAGGPPNGTADVAVFDTSATTAVSLSANTQADGIAFNAGASAYTITVSPASMLILGGVGITNNSDAPQSFVAAAEKAGAGHGMIEFINSATAGNDTHFTAAGATTVPGWDGGFIGFFDTATAGSATFTTNGGSTEWAWS